MMKSSFLLPIMCVTFLAQLPRCGAAQMSQPSCYKTSDPNITHVDVLYDEDDDNNNLWKGSGPAPLCSSVSPPSSSECVVCYQEVIYAVCSNLPTGKTLMEGGGREIPISESECPVFLKNGPSGSGDTTGSPSLPFPAGSNFLWLLIIPFIIIVIIIAVVVYRHRGKICRTIKSWRGRKPVPSDEPGDVAETPL